MVRILVEGLTTTLGTCIPRGGGDMSVAGRVTSRPYDKHRVKVAVLYSRVGRVNGLNESADCECYLSNSR